MNSNTIIGILIILLLVGGAFYYLHKDHDHGPEHTDEDSAAENTEQPIPVEPDGGIGDGAEPLDELLEAERKDKTTLGKTAGGASIVANHYGTGEDELLFIGGTHGGYSGNTVLVAYELMDYLEDNPDVIPENVMVTVIPLLNVDGVREVYTDTAGRLKQSDIITDASVTTPGRFNANEVDLNRNFDCQWQPQGTWQNRTVSGGSAAFSEPEAQAVRDYVEANDIAGALVWYSAAGGVYSSNCNNGVMTETKSLTNLYASAAGYSAHEEFDFYEITGDMVNWFAKEEIPAISVLLSDHRNAEWDKNRKGVDAMLNYFAE